MLFPILVMTLMVATLGPASAREHAATITVTDEVSPKSVTVAPGASVEFVNNGTERHRLRTTAGPAEFDTGDLDPGGSATVVLLAVGTYQYEDHRNDHDARYQGTIIVSTDGGSTGGGDPAPGPGATTVSILDRSFSPASISITAGSTITWTNVSGRDHTVTANNGSFDSGNMPSGASWSRTFTSPGTFSYFCIFHPDMVGVVSVGGADQPPPPPPPPPTTSPPPPAPPPPSTGSLNIVDFAFNPASTSARVGDTLVWTNFGVAPHTVTADNGSFDSGTLASGDSWSRTFTSPGTFSYFCVIHPGMRGVVVIGAADEPPPPPPPVPPPPPASGDSPVGSGAAGPVTGNVEMIDFAFRPGSISARVGDTIVWANNGLAPHTATARDGTFDTGFVSPGSRASTRLTKAGTYSFYCTLHPEMTGTLTVDEAPDGTTLLADGTDLDGGIAADGDTGSLPSASVDGTTQSAEGGTDEERAVTTVAVIDFDYLPRRLQIEAGTTVIWEWKGDIAHTVTEQNGGFDSGILEKGASWSRVFDDVGQVEYYCTLHPDMVGFIEVVAPSVDELEPDIAQTGLLSVPASDSGGSWKGFVGGGIFTFGCGLFMLAFLKFLRWTSTEEAHALERRG